MLKREDGFSLIELMVTVTVLGMTIAAASNVFVVLFKQLKQQTSITEVALQDIVNLEILKRDIEHAGYGLPWTLPVGVAYTETNSASPAYNDSPSTPPRALVSDNNNGLFGSDYLVLKSVYTANNNVSQLWTRLAVNGVTRANISGQTLNNGDGVIVMNTESGGNTLVADGVTFGTTFGNVTSAAGVNFQPTDQGTYVVYAVSPTVPVRPFNRSDYFISNVNVPTRCAGNTGVLVKADVAQDVPGTLTTSPLLECVADMQVVYYRDIDGDGAPDAVGTTGNISALNAQQIREQVIEVRVYILAHEGRRDRDFIYPTNTVIVGPTAALGSNFDLTTTDPLWANYRWKVHTLVIRPDTLG